MLCVTMVSLLIIASTQPVASTTRTVARCPASTGAIVSPTYGSLPKPQALVLSCLDTTRLLMRKNFASSIGAIQNFVVDAELHAGLACDSRVMPNCRRHFWLNAISDNALDHGGEVVGEIPNRGLVLLHRGDYSSAFDWLRNQYVDYGVNHDPSLEDPGFYRSIESALAAAAIGDFAKAQKFLDQCKRISATAPDVYFIDGAISLARHDNHGARKSWTEGIRRFRYSAGIPPRYGNGWSLNCAYLLTHLQQS